MIIHVHYRAPHQWILPLCLWIMSHRLHRSGFSPQTFRGCSDVSELLKMWFNVGISQIYWLPVLLRLVFRCLSVSDELVDLLLAPLAAELIGWAARCGFNQTHRREEFICRGFRFKHTVGSLCVRLFVLQAAVFAFGVKTAAAEEGVC